MGAVLACTVGVCFVLSFVWVEWFGVGCFNTALVWLFCIRFAFRFYFDLLVGFRVRQFTLHGEGICWVLGVPPWTALFYCRFCFRLML